MKKTILPLAIILGLSISFTSCGGGEEKKEEPVKDTTTVVEEPLPPAREYKYTVEEVDVTPRWAVTIGDSTAVDGLKEFFMKNFPMIGKCSGMKKEDIKDAPLAIYYDFSETKKFYTVAAMYINDSTKKVKAPAKVEKLYGGKALKVKYLGAYEKTGDAYTDLMAYMEEKGMVPAGAPWEQYVTDPGMEKDTLKWQTDIYFPVMPK